MYVQKMIDALYSEKDGVPEIPDDFEEWKAKKNLRQKR